MHTLNKTWVSTPQMVLRKWHVDPPKLKKRSISFVGLSSAFQNGMLHTGSSNSHGEDASRVRALIGGHSKNLISGGLCNEKIADSQKTFDPLRVPNHRNLQVWLLTP